MAKREQITSNKACVIIPHKSLILIYLYPLLSLLIIPAVRGALSFRQQGALSQFILGEIVLAVVAVILAIAKWHRCRLTIKDGGFIFNRGLIVHKKIFIPQASVSVVSILDDPILLFVGAAGLKIFSSAGLKNETAIDLPIKLRDSALLKQTFPQGENEKVYKCPFIKTVIMAAATSSAATGLLIAAPVVNQISKLLGVAVNQIVLKQINDFSNSLPDIIPSAGRVVSIILVTGYIISFIFSLLRNSNFIVSRLGDSVIIRAGVFPRRNVMFSAKNIMAVSKISNPIMQILGHKFVKVSAGGYGEKRGEKSILLPAVNNLESEKHLKDLLFEFPTRPAVRLRPPMITIGKFIFPSITIVAVTFIAQIILVKIFSDFTELITFSAMVSTAIALLLLYINVIRFIKGGIVIDKYVSAVSGKYLSLIEQNCLQKDVCYYKITRYPFDILQGFCRIKVAVRNKNTDCLTVKHLLYKDVKKEVYPLYGLEKTINSNRKNTK